MGQVKMVLPEADAMVATAFCSSAIPHFGQSPGLSDTTPGHIGQKYFAADDGSGLEFP